MSEKLRRPKQPESQPEIRAETEGGFVPTAAEENVLAIMHEKTQAHRGSEKPPRDEELLNSLHKDVEHCECYPLFQKYVSGELPTVERMFSNLQPLLEELRADIAKDIAAAGTGAEDPHVKEMQQVQKLLEGRDRQVRDAIQRYVNSVIRFRQLAKLSVGGVRDMTKQFEEADHARRRAHNSLIESLAIYARQVNKLNELGYGDSQHFPFVNWQTNIDARTIPVGKTPVMTESALKNRDFVRDWAIVADFKDQLELLGDDL